MYEVGNLYYLIVHGKQLIGVVKSASKGILVIKKLNSVHITVEERDCSLQGILGTKEYLMLLNMKDKLYIGDKITIKSSPRYKFLESQWQVLDINLDLYKVLLSDIHNRRLWVHVSLLDSIIKDNNRLCDTG